MVKVDRKPRISPISIGFNIIVSVVICIVVFVINFLSSRLSGFIENCLKHRLLDCAGTAAKINVALKPRDRYCMLGMAHVLIVQGKLPEATAVVERWIDNSRGDYLAHLLACELHIEQSNPSEAKRHLAAATPIDYKPEFVRASERLNRLEW